MRGRLIALRPQHLLGLRVAQPVLRVVGARAEREELQELPELVGAQDVAIRSGPSPM